MMKHLTVNEIIDFVSVEKLDAESLALISKVNSHILKCDKCLCKVRAFTAVYEEMKRVMYGREELVEAIRKNVDKEMLSEVYDDTELTER